jgi:hypothetical protein
MGAEHVFLFAFKELLTLGGRMKIAHWGSAFQLALPSVTV